MKKEVKHLIVRIFYSYTNAGLISALHSLRIASGDTLMVHSSWLPHNGFRGRPLDMIRALQATVGPDGLLVMPSLTYQNESTREFLARGEPMNVRRSPSRMGLLTEVFRRNKDVQRSLSPTHPLLAWGRDATAFLAGHEQTAVPFGADSPFARLVERNGKILTIDAPFSTITFTHYLEDRIADSLPLPLYDAPLMTGCVIDHIGRTRAVPVQVISDRANTCRREARLVAALEQRKAIQRRRVGNTRLMLIDCRSMVECVDSMTAVGESFFDPPL